jgi:hypothetical protein
VQPVLGASHRDARQPMVNLYAAENIPPLTELSYDYGVQYVREKLRGACRCGAAACVGDALRAGGAAGGEAEGAAGGSPAAHAPGPFRLPGGSPRRGGVGGAA